LSSDLYKVLRCGTAGVDVQSARALLAEVGMHTRRMSTLALCLLVVRPAFADEQSSPAAATQLVIVDVAVTDKKGRLVTGLRADAFEIYEDGGLVPFENFRAPGEAPPAAGVAEQAIPAPPAPVAAPLLVVYVDNDNLGPANRSRVLDGLKRSLDERLAAGGTRMLLVGDVQGVKALTGVTAERREVAAAIDVLARSTARGDQASDERSTLEIVHDIIKMADETPFMGGCLGVLEDVISVLRRHADLRSQRVGLTVGRLSTLVQALGSLPGPKTLLYVSEGFEQRPGIHLFQQLGEICPEALTKEFSKVHAPMGEHDASPMLRELVALANVLRVTIYTFDAAGLRGGSLASPESKDRATCLLRAPRRSERRTSSTASNCYRRVPAVFPLSTRTCPMPSSRVSATTWHDTTHSAMLRPTSQKEGSIRSRSGSRVRAPAASSCATASRIGTRYRPNARANACLLRSSSA
jgi:VWFA-related protein